MNLYRTCLLIALAFQLYSCQQTVIEQLNEIACSCYEAKLESGKVDNLIMSCFDASNFENLEDLIIDENSELTKERQGEIMADSLIKYSIKNCDAILDHYDLHRAQMAEESKSFIAKSQNISRQLLWDSTHTSLNLTKTLYGSYLFIFNENTKAKQVLREVPETDPEYNRALTFLAWAYEKDNQYEAAMKEYEKLLALDPDNYESMMLMELIKRKVE